MLGIILRTEVGNLRKSVRRLTFKLAALFFVLSALCFGFIALFLWLSTIFEPWVAALVIGALLIMLSLILLLAGRVGGRAPQRHSNAQLMAGIEQVATSLKAKDVSLATIGAILAVGFVIGRRNSK